MKKGKLKWLVCVALMIVALVVTQFYPLMMLSVFSVLQINLQKQGYEDPETHEWKDSYWVIGLVTDTFEHYEGISYTFDNEEAQGANTVGEKTLVVNSEVKVTIIPEKPYFERAMEYVTYTVYPKTYGTWMNKVHHGMIGKLGEDTSIGGLNVSVLQFTDESWKLYTPFKVQLYKNGELKAEKYVNTVGGTETVILTGNFPEEDVKIQNLGKLGTGLGEPAFGNLIVLDTAHIFKVEGNILAEIKYDKDPYSYSNYWFGGGEHYYAVAGYGSGPVMRWGEDGSPAHYWIWGGINEPMETQMFPGSTTSETLTDWHIKPVPADVFNDKPKDQPVEGNPFGYSLVNYLANKRGHKLYVLDDLDEYNQGIEIKDNKMRIYLPLSSFNNLVTVWISTEVADAIVYQPVPAKGVFTTVQWLSTGGTSSAISDKDIVSATVKQEGKDGGRITITASGMTSYPMQVSPTTDSVILNYGETYTFFFTVKNLGTTTVQSGNLRFVLTNDAGEQTDSKILSFELKPQIGDKTILTVNLHDRNGFRPSGVLVTVNYGVDSKSGVTSNGYVTFDLETYKGSVSIATQETDAYRAASTSATVSAGQNSVFLELQKKGEPSSVWNQIMEWIVSNPIPLAIVTVAASIVAVFYAMSRRR
jgi:hypothetical protein